MRSVGLKRAVDIVASTIGLVLMAIPMAVIALAVRWKIGSPVLFRQVRPGLNTEPFTLVKFRTMIEGTGSDADRITTVGRFLRKTSLDETPELWNILRGDLSLVGPRPLLTSYLPRYNPHQARRHEVRPGLTGLAQVQGRNALTWEERFELDVQYVENWTIPGDVSIIFRTFGAVLRQDGVSADGHVTMPEFEGTDK